MRGLTVTAWVWALLAAAIGSYHAGSWWESLIRSIAVYWVVVIPLWLISSRKRNH